MRTKATLIYRRTGNLRAVQLLLGHHRIDYVRYLGVEVDDALDIAERIEVCITRAGLPHSARKSYGRKVPISVVSICSKAPVLAWVYSIT
jgi:hypothetical protein